jgi:NAD(P)-dependent dehydrogenase (short-subunit alcohol dehydrogenase family)
MNPHRPPLLLQGKAAIVTGAASGIGLAIARALAARGVDLAIADIDAPALERAHAELVTAGRRVASHVLDVGDARSVAQAAAHFDEWIGPIHLLFNNAGIDMSGTLASLTLDDWRRAFDINVFGIVHGLKHFLPLLQRHGERAHVVNTASGAGFWVNPDATMGAYAATKYAVVAISEALEQELAGSPVGVSVLCPGPVATAIAQRSPRASDRLRADLAAGTAPQDVAHWLLEAIVRDEFYVFTPNRMAERLQQRTARILQALARVPGHPSVAP